MYQGRIQMNKEENQVTEALHDVYPDYPLTKTQLGIFIESQAYAGTTIYNIPFLFKISDKVDINRLKTAIEKTIDAHPYVKMTLFLKKEQKKRYLG